MTDLEKTDEPLGDRVKLLELAVAVLADRTADVERLSEATDRLSESTEGLDGALREVGQIKAQTKELAQKVESAATASDIAGLTEGATHAVPRRWFWVGALIVALVGALVAYGWWDRGRIRAQIRDDQRQVCQLQAQLGHPCEETP